MATFPKCQVDTFIILDPNFGVLAPPCSRCQYNILKKIKHEKWSLLGPFEYWFNILVLRGTTTTAHGTDSLFINAWCHYYPVMNRATQIMRSGIRQIFFLPGTHLHHLGREWQMWVNVLRLGLAIGHQCRGGTRTAKCVIHIPVTYPLVQGGVSQRY